MEAEAAVVAGAYADVVDLIRTAVRWTLDTEGVGIRRRAMEAVTAQLQLLRERQPEGVVTVCRELKDLLDGHPPPRHKHQRQHVVDWVVAVYMGTA